MPNKFKSIRCNEAKGSFLSVVNKNFPLHLEKTAPGTFKKGTPVVYSTYAIKKIRLLK